MKVLGYGKVTLSSHILSNNLHRKFSFSTPLGVYAFHDLLSFKQSYIKRRQLVS